MTGAKEAVAGKAHDIKESVQGAAADAKDTITGKASQAKARNSHPVAVLCSVV